MILDVPLYLIHRIWKSMDILLLAKDKKKWDEGILDIAIIIILQPFSYYLYSWRFSMLFLKR
jgi:hypothetical protein